MNKPISRKDFELELHKMPAFENYVSNLVAMKNADLTNWTSQEIEKLYFNTAVVFPGFTTVIPSAVMNSAKLYRVRRNIDFKHEDLFSKQTFSYPPHSVIYENGRANLKGKSVFYCGHTYFTALKESKIQRGDIAYLSVWSVNTNRNCEYCAFIPDQLPDNNPWKDLSSIQGIKSFNSANSLSKSQHLEYLHSFIAQLFVDERPPYCLTSWLANKMLLGYDNVDFLVYPSFEVNSTKCNMVFKTEFVDKFMVLDRVFKLRAIEVSTSNVALNIVAVGEPGKVRIDWRDPSDEDDEFLQRK